MENEFKNGLATPVRFVRGVGEVRAAQLERLAIHTAGDLLTTLPRRYEDRRHIQPISALVPGEVALAAGAVVSCGFVRPRYGAGYFECVLSDGRGAIRARWFGAAYLQDRMRPGDQILVCGKVQRRRGETVMPHPEFEMMRDDAEGGESLHLGRIVPVYPLTELLPQRTMRRILWNAVDHFAAHAEECLPAETLARGGWMGLREALREVHFPSALAAAERARDRLKFEEFLCMQLVLAARKLQSERLLVGLALDAPGRLRERFLAALPFRLTGAQERAVADIRADMKRPHPMHRLLQGDVGSGKTVVAAVAILDALECGAQAVVMAPTEILAAQHAATFGRFLEPLGFRPQVLTGGGPAAARTAARAAVAAGRARLIVGTHAVIQERVVFQNLGLAVIDEQHKFGVEQRGLLYQKGTHPDVLVMTATPIPRTLAMTLYGDLDVSLIDELPPGRTPVVTRVVAEAQLDKVYAFIRTRVAEGRQAYVVYPAVEESELLDLKAATEMHRALAAGPLAGLRLGLLHGQLPAEEKEAAMRRFATGQTDVLVATTVVEVGMDVPNATVMLVENAERFGLAQLHQLRGRVGRGAHKSYCILQGAPASRDAWRRLKIMEETTDGFRIAEEDFRLRGMGNLLGREQSGLPLLRVGDPLADVRLLEAARREAFALAEPDPRLARPDLRPLRERARALFRAAAAYVKVG